MRIARVYSSRVELGVNELDVEQSKHLLRVLRACAGDQVELFDGRGTLGRGVVKKTGKNTATVEVANVDTALPHQKGKVIIAASVAKGSRFDTLVEKLTELGVDHILPVVFERTVKQPANPGIVNRYERIALNALKQCKKLFLPRIEAPVDFPAMSALINNLYPHVEMMFGSTESDAPSVLARTELNTCRDRLAVIGPEGGFTNNELYELKNMQAKPVKLTDTILRVETAALALAAVLCTLRDQSTESK